MASFWVRSSIPGPSNNNRRPIPRRHCDLEDAQAPNHPLNTNEKTPLLRNLYLPNYSSAASSSSPSEPHVPSDPEPPQQYPNLTFHHRLRIRKLLLILLCISILTPIYHIAKALYYCFPCNPRPPPVNRWRYYTRQHSYGLNANSTSQYYTLAVTESINSSHFPQGVSGRVQILTGRPYQSHNILVYVQVFSTSYDPVQRVKTTRIINPRLGEDVFVNSVYKTDRTGDALRTIQESETFVNIYVYTRPDSRRLGHTSISTNILDIKIPPGNPRFETYRLALLSNHGTITNEKQIHDPDPLSVSFLTVSSTHGTINGTWTYQTSFSATASEKSVDINLQPQRISWGPWTPGDVSIVSGGDAFVRMPFEDDTLSLRNGSISITSHNGDINARLVSGYYTNLTAARGNIHARIFPYWECNSPSSGEPGTLRLESWSKNDTFVTVLPPKNDGSMWYINPLSVTVAKHTAETGSLWVKYPVDFWRGDISVQSVNERADIIGVGGKHVKDVIRDSEGSVRMIGKQPGSWVDVKGGGDASFEFWPEYR